MNEPASSSSPRTNLRLVPSLALALVVSTAACKGAPPAAPFRSISPNAFANGAKPTFIVGTLGDDKVDARIRGQAELVRQLFFATAPLAADTEVKPDALPPQPILYGGPAVNAVTAALAPGLPFEVAEDHLRIGSLDLVGDAWQLITVVPERTGPYAHPELLFYGGTGHSGGVAEINAVGDGSESILVADAFGPYVVGKWVQNDDGSARPVLEHPAARIKWRVVSGTLASHAFPADLGAGPHEDELIQASEAGVNTAATALGLTKPAPITIYYYPDVRSKQALTGKAGDGHAAIAARALHLVSRPDPASIQHLVAHEATHVLAYEAVGAPGSPLFGEGVAVWVAGQYGGGTLDEWRAHLPDKLPTVADLIGPGFRKLPEREAYPLAGILVSVAVERVGRGPFFASLYGANAATWAEACKRAGTTADELEAAFKAKLATPPPAPPQ